MDKQKDEQTDTVLYIYRFEKTCSEKYNHMVYYFNPNNIVTCETQWHLCEPVFMIGMDASH